MAHTHISLPERRRIAELLRKGTSVREIARKLGRGKSSVADEIKRRSIKGAYDPRKADHKAYVARRNAKQQCLKVATDPILKAYVARHMQNDQSPEGISGRLKHVEKGVRYASHKAVRNFIASVHGRELERHLHSHAVRKRSGPKQKKPASLDGRVMIDTRPAHVEKRLEFGHFEGDFIESGRDGTGSLLVLVERKSRYPFLAYLEDRSTRSVNALVADLLKDVPVRSLTLDNDISFQKHPELSEMLDAVIFFCHPQSPHEKGTVENRNKAIRRYVPKRCDISKKRDVIIPTQQKLRERFMECLGFRTPEEVFEAEMKKHAEGRGMLKKAKKEVLKVNQECPV